MSLLHTFCYFVQWIFFGYGIAWIVIILCRGWKIRRISVRNACSAHSKRFFLIHTWSILLTCRATYYSSCGCFLVTGGSLSAYNLYWIRLTLRNIESIVLDPNCKLLAPLVMQSHTIILRRIDRSARSATFFVLVRHKYTSPMYAVVQLEKFDSPTILVRVFNEASDE